MIKQIHEIADSAIISEIKTFPNQGFIWEIIERQNTGKIFELSSGANLIIDNCRDPFVFIAGEMRENDLNEIVDLVRPLQPVTLYCNVRYHTMFLRLGWDFGECSPVDSYSLCKNRLNDVSPRDGYPSP